VRTWLQYSINANCSKTVKVTDLQFDKHVHKDSPDTTPQKIFQKGAWPGSREPLNFLGVKCQLLKMVKDTDFKFDEHVHGDSSDMNHQKIFVKGAWPGSRDPQNFWALNGSCSKRLKIWTSNLTSTSTGTVRTRLLGKFPKRGVARVT